MYNPTIKCRLLYEIVFQDPEEMVIGSNTTRVSLIFISYNWKYYKCYYQYSLLSNLLPRPS
jgi:hypothetical protein